MNSPLSRIGSTTRLNNQNSPLANSPAQGAQSPSMTTPYVINTVTTTTGTTPAVVQAYQGSTGPDGADYNSELKIFKEIQDLELLVGEITKSIGTFKSPEFGTVQKLVAKVDSIENAIAQIKTSTQLARDHSLKANQSNIELTNLLREVLLELKACRKTLLGLPADTGSTNKGVNHHNSVVSTEMLLEYALKLSKFSKIPRMIDMNVTAANFVWPGEDSLRRGVLAMVSNDPSKFIDFDISDDKVQADRNAAVETHAVAEHESDEEEMHDFEDVHIEVKKKETTDAVEGLDLFDSEEEDD